MTRIPASLFLLLLAFTFPLEAQEKGSPKQFFDPGYVNAPRNGETPVAESSSANSFSSRYSSSETSASEGMENTESSSSAASKEAEDAYGSGEGVLVKGMSVFLAAQDPEHFRRELDDALKLSERAKVKINDLYLVGNTEPIYRERVLGSFAARTKGIVTRVVNKIPAGLGDIQRSPALLIDSRKGKLVVEGYPSIFKLFNSKGEFLPPAGELKVASPTPTSAPSSAPARASGSSSSARLSAEF